MGRSRCGLTTTVVAAVTDEDTAVVVYVVPGQAGDSPLLEPMLDATRERMPVIDELVGDKAFDGDPRRQACIDRNMFPNVPGLKNRLHPEPFDQDGYREGNKIERLFGKAKQFRRYATRYEKPREMFLGSFSWFSVSST